LSGELGVQSAEGSRSVYFFKGRPVLVVESRTSEPLGRILLEAGVISQEEYDLSLMETARSGKKHGQVLVERGSINVEQLKGALDSQLRRKLNKIFFLKDATFVFKAGTDWLPEPGIYEQPRISTLSIIYHGIRNSMKDAALEEALLIKDDTVVRLSGDFYSMSLSLPLEPEDVIVAEQLLKPKTFKELLELRILPRTGLLMLLYYLKTLELIEFVRDGEEAAAVTDEIVMLATDLLLPPDQQSPDGEPSGSLDPKLSDEYLTAQYFTDLESRPVKLTDPAHHKGALTQDQIVSISAEMVRKYSSLAIMDYYAVLDVGRDADEARISRAYHELCKRYSPSLLEAADENTRNLAAAVREKANEAFATLTTPQLKAEYNGVLETVRTREIDTGALAGEAELEFHKGDFALKKKDYRKALKAFARAMELGGQIPDYVAAYGWALYNDPEQPEQMRRSMGKEYLKKSVVLGASCARAFIHLSSVARAEGRDEEARKHLAEAARLNPDHELLGDQQEWLAGLLGDNAGRQSGNQERQSADSGFFSRIFGRK
jgi:curved DNA-binding protein CbpA